jgi:ABC-type sugar transport system ATPase subunit
MAHGNNRVETELGPLWVADSRHCHGAVIVGVRPEDVHLQRSSNENENRIEGKVRNSVFLGDQIVCEIDVRGKILIAKGSPNDGEPSDTVFVYLPRERLVVFSDRVPSDSLG